MKQKLDAHPSVLIAYSNKAKKILLNVYDAGYPKTVYRGSVNLIGGNPKPDDQSPEEVLIREILEEINPNHSIEKKYVGKVNWAPESEIRLIRNSLFQFTPLQDFLVEQRGIIEGGNKPYLAIYSTFYSEISEKIVHCVEKNIMNGKHIFSEGTQGVFTLEQLAHNPRGKFFAAHATAHILNWRYSSKIPYPEQIVVEAIGSPRKKFKDYLNEFTYDQERLVLASQSKN